MVTISSEADMNEVPISQTEAKTLRFLRVLVTVLTTTMIFGVLAIVALLVIRFTQTPASVNLPDEIVLPGGTTATAFTRGPDWFAIVTSDDEILIFDSESNTLLKTLKVRD